MSTDPRQRILLVEDDQAVASLLSRYLTKRGFQVTKAENAELALQKYRSDGYDIVLADVHLPGASGLDLTEHLHEISPLQPVVVVTGDRDQSIAEAARKLGATAYILKPFETAEVEAAVRQALKDRELSESALDLLKAEFVDSPKEGLGALSSEVLHLAEERSRSGEGHGYRVARLADALLTSGGVATSEAVEMAARTHEFGALIKAGDFGTDLRARSLFVLRELGVDPLVLDLVDGLYRPTLHAKTADSTRRHGAAALYVADQLDHAFLSRANSGSTLDEARRYAFGIVLVQAEPALPSVLLDAVLACSDLARELWRSYLPLLTELQ